MKKLIAFALILTFAVALVSCATQTTPEATTYNYYTSKVTPTAATTATETANSSGTVTTDDTTEIEASTIVSTNEINHPTYEPVISGNFVFTKNIDGKSYTIKAANTEISGHIDIPDMFDGLPVTDIAATEFDSSHKFVGGFANCQKITGITIPDSVKNIGNDAFRNCFGLREITIGNGIEELNMCLFSTCRELSILNICSQKITMNTSENQYYTKNSQQYKTVSIGSGTKEIGAYAFNEAINLKKISLPETLEYIGRYSFTYSTSIEVIEIPNGVTEIDDYAFSHCKNLKNVTLSKGLEKINVGAFAYCASLKEITIPEDVKNIGIAAFYGCDNLSGITLPNGVERIGCFAFCNCKKIESVSLPESLISVGAYAFDGCTNLKRIDYAGSKEQWNAVIKDQKWIFDGNDCTVYCSDGTVKATSNGIIHMYDNGISETEYYGEFASLRKIKFKEIYEYIESVREYNDDSYMAKIDNAKEWVITALTPEKFLIVTVEGYTGESFVRYLDPSKKLKANYYVKLNRYGEPLTDEHIYIMEYDGSPSEPYWGNHLLEVGKKYLKMNMPMNYADKYKDKAFYAGFILEIKDVDGILWVYPNVRVDLSNMDSAVRIMDDYENLIYKPGVDDDIIEYLNSRNIIPPIYEYKAEISAYINELCMISG